MAQLEFKGVELKGISTAGTLDSLRKQGLIAAWEADKGIVLSGSGVQSWADMIDGYTLRQYAAATQPTFNPQFSTNLFPAIIFGVSGGSKRLTNNQLGQFFNNNKPFTIIQLINAQTNSFTSVSLSMGWTSATNGSTSQITFKPSDGGAGFVNARMGIASDSNTVNLSHVGVTTTNQYHYFAAIVDSTTARMGHNLILSSATTITPYQRTLDTFTIGSLVGTNSASTQGWTGAFTGIYVFSNAVSTTDYTNIINKLNTKFKVYN